MKTVLKSGQKYIIRIDKGEEVISSLEKFCQKEKVKAGFFRGLGAAAKGELRYYSLKDKRYYNKKFGGKTMEILSLLGNVAEMKGKTVIHAHIVLGNEKMQPIGGHVSALVVGPTCEIYFEKLPGKIERKYSQEIGLNLMV